MRHNRILLNAHAFIMKLMLLHLSIFLFSNELTTLDCEDGGVAYSSILSEKKHHNMFPDIYILERNY